MVKSPPGWSVFFDKVNTIYDLDHVDFYSGHPDGLAQLVPDTSKGKSVWNFSRGPNIYQVCVYNDTSQRLTRPIPKGLKRCEVGYRATSGPQAVHTKQGNAVIESITCK